MPEHALPCVKCGKPLRNIAEAGENQPYGGTEFTTTGHYGSTIHDELGNKPIMELVVDICDTCILRAIEAGVIQSRSRDGSIKLANHHLSDESKAWVLAQNEKAYGSAWGDDTPQNYEELMLKAGWPEEMIGEEDTKMAEEFVDYVEVFEGKDKQWYFHAKSNNGEVLSTSEGYGHKAAASLAAESMFPGKSLVVKEDA